MYQNWKENLKFVFEAVILLLLLSIYIFMVGMAGVLILGLKSNL